MLRGYRGVIIAVAGLSLLAMAMGIGAYFGALYSPHKKQYEAVSSGHASGVEYRGPSESLSDISGIPGFAERAIANPQPASGQDHEKRDLAAQESMAVWAFWMMLVAAFSAIVTTIGTVFLYKQIRLTREAVEDTGKATIAMREGNEIARAASEQTRRLGEAQIKAYVTVTKIEANYQNGRFAIAPHLSNSGQTPAYIQNAKCTIVPRSGDNLTKGTIFVEPICAGASEKIGPFFFHVERDDIETVVVRIDGDSLDVFGMLSPFKMLFAGPAKWDGNGQATGFAAGSSVASAIRANQEREANEDASD